ncbi:response regulator transcription factor [Secundilactobacillus collinoides]|uniref:DNA-binding response regulator n=3 Tax=Secundilactobacillus collinoides TaxID=33960 RepID=A0A0R2B7S3_SECCO|nr:response regulator transcription factor [Secundilactobacillus collinoides]KRM75136.1 DNA-binding response regulator [Secundilactobacillus collinoides DSM 20515 = JCM 1123]KZL40226.1 PhoP family transcriptional regulator [Secundilactobacillus collinoides]
MKLLMIEDNKSVSEMMQMFFKKEDWDAHFAYDGIQAVKMFKETPNDWDMITLDLNLPGMDGMQASAEIRKLSPTVPIIMLTARDSESDQVLGLEMGADDYVTKPFSPITLIARIKALDRRAKLGSSKSTAENTAVAVSEPEEADEDSRFEVTTDNFRLNSKTREAYLNGKQIRDLTPKEFDLLKTLATKPRQVFSREQLLQLVWDYEYYGDERTVDAHIKKLRQKIEKVGPQIIQTVWGVGYKFDDTGADK